MKMEKLIKGKRYDTDSAHLVAQDRQVPFYRKTTGEFFLFDKEADKISPLSDQRAAEVGKKLLAAFQYEILFNALPKTEAQQASYMKLPKSIHQELRKAATS